jgi:hypothetical protein
MYNDSKTYWQISGGQIWSPPEGKFVTPPDDALLITLKGKSGEAATLADLREIIAFYNKQGLDFPLGELAAKAEPA